MCKCSHINCQFQNFIATQNNKEFFYFNDTANGDNYCIFHAPQKIKQNFRITQNEIFQNLIEQYIIDCILKHKKIDFSNTIFIDCNFKDKNFINIDMDFSNATFIKNVRFDNIKCKNLIFKDTKFLDGGAIKNRYGDQSLIIENLEFRPYSLGSDFVIDIGRYANNEGLIEKNHQGVIKNLRFENHKEGNGTIFFVGLNEHLANADFKNMILDKVSFQNCDLKNCYFLNSKIDKTEFRNCYFPQNYNRQILTNIQGSRETKAFFTFPILVGIFLILNFLKPTAIKDFIQYEWFFYSLLIISIIYILFFLSSINVWAEFIFSILAKSLNEKGITVRSLQVHYAIADEKEIYEKLSELPKQKINFKVQQNILQETLDSLSTSYAQLKENFKDKDFQASGDFFYSQRYTEILSSHKKGFIELQMLHIHHFTNGFGEIYMKPLLWFVFTLVLFAIPLVPNKDYISTYSTPLFLIQDVNNTSDEKTTQIYLNISEDKNRKMSFYKSLVLDRNDINSSSEIFYGYDGRYNYNNNLKEQYILRLDENSSMIGISKSLSNLLYPFTPEQKKWFQNISPKAVALSFVESILLWYFAIAFALALWHRIKR